MAADSRCLRCRMAWMSASRFIRARTCTTALRSRCSSICSRAIRAAIFSTIQATSCCSNSTIWSTSISTTPHQDVPRQGCGVQSHRAAGRLWRIPVVGQPCRTLPLAGRWAGEFPGNLLQADAVRFSGLGGDGVGVLHQELDAGREEGAPFIAKHIIRAAERSFDDFADAQVDKASHRQTAGNSRQRVATMIGGTESSKLTRRLRLGMVGGGPGAFIGAVHRAAARLDDRYELVAAALSSEPAEVGERSPGVVHPQRLCELFRDGGRGSEAKRRYRCGCDRHTEPYAPCGRDGLSQGRHPRHLRQAFDHDAGGCRGACPIQWLGPD